MSKLKMIYILNKKTLAHTHTYSYAMVIDVISFTNVEQLQENLGRAKT